MQSTNKRYVDICILNSYKTTSPSIPWDKMQTTKQESFLVNFFVISEIHDSISACVLFSNISMRKPSNLKVSDNLSLSKSVPVLSSRLWSISTRSYELMKKKRNNNDKITENRYYL